MIPSEEDPHRWRASYAILGVAGLLIATVFAVVASLATRPASQVRPLSDLPGPVIANSATDVPSAPQTTGTDTGVPQSAPPSDTAAPGGTPTPPPAGQPPAPPPPVGPMAVFTADCRDLSCTFDAHPSSDPDGTIVSYAWNFGDSAGIGSSTNSHPRHDYARARTYIVILVVTDNKGRSSQASERIPVGG